MIFTKKKKIFLKQYMVGNNMISSCRSLNYILVHEEHPVE